MHFRLAAVLGLAATLALAGPAAANHDNGNGFSQDHLHRNNVSAGGVVTASEPFTLGLLGLGLGTAALLARRRR